jgi:hypothetical protein
MYPTMYGDQGWYAFEPQPYRHNVLELYYLSMRPEDRKRIGRNAWLEFLEGRNPNFPEQAMRADFARIRQQVETIDADTTTPDTRLSDDPMRLNPAAVESLVQLTLGGLHSGKVGQPLHARLRYFDPERRRAGLPQDVAALVDSLAADSVSVTLVNTSQVEPRTVIVQAGGYGEHRFTSVGSGNKVSELASSTLTVRLAPGTGQRLTLGIERYANPPRMQHPW